MIEKIEIPILFFLLLFLGAAIFFYRYKRKGMHDYLLETSPWNTVVKIFYIWCGILFARKLAYYFPFDGVMQTKDAVWWISDISMVVLVLTALMLTVTIIGVRAVNKTTDSGSQRSFLPKFLFAWMLCVVFILGIMGELKVGTVVGNFIFINFIPLLLLKMLFSGKYFGILTALLASLIITPVAIARKKRATKDKKKSWFAVALIFIGIFTLKSNFVEVSGNWSERFTAKARAAENMRGVEDLLDAVATIKNQNYKEEAFKETAAAIARTGDIRRALNMTERIGNKWSKIEALSEIAAALDTKDIEIAEEVLKQCVKVAGTIKNKLGKSVLLKKIALYAANSGNFKWAVSIAESIPEIKIKARTLWKIGQIKKKKEMNRK